MADRSHTAIACLIWLSGILITAPIRAADLVVFTEDYPPYSFTDTNGNVVGEATARVRLILKEAGVDFEIRLMPWVRAEKLARLQPNSMIYSMAYSKERSARFDWIAPIAKPDMYLFARKDLAGIVTRDTIAAGRYTALCVETDASCAILRRVGFPQSALVQASTGGASEPLMVHYGRADLFLGDMNLQPYREFIYGFAAKELKPVLAVEDRLEFFLAAGLQVEESLRDRVRKAYGRLKARGGIDTFKRLEVPAETAQK